MNPTSDVHYQAPGWPTQHLVNPMMRGLTRLGISVRGSRILETRGRRSGLPRRVPVNLLTVDGVEYLVAPRGETQWVRNVRAGDGQVTLQLGRRRQVHHSVEVPVADRVPLLREYLRRWKAETGVFFGGLSAQSSDQELAAIADQHPVFRLS